MRSSMERWVGILKVSLNPSNGGPSFKVAASLLLRPSSKTLAVPSVNGIFFKGDRVDGSGNSAIDRLSDSKNIAEILVSKLGESANVWVIEASAFRGPFALFTEFIPSVNFIGEPQRYDPNGYPASTSIVAILSKSIHQIESDITMSSRDESAIEGQLQLLPRTAVLGFSKGGIVINQILAELAHLNGIGSSEAGDGGGGSILPASPAGFLRSISELHYVDAGLSRSGAHLTDRSVIEGLARDSSLRVIAMHGTPRQWRDLDRPWICQEKDSLLGLLRKAGGRLQVLERLYFADSPPSLQMHFEVIQALDIDPLPEKP